MHQINVNRIAMRSMVSLALVVSLFSITVRSQVQDSTAPKRVKQAKMQTALSGRPFVIRNARIFDGKRVDAADSVFVRDGKIQLVGRDLKVPPGTEEIDAGGGTLLPGLIDSHTHDWGNSAKQALLFGVTTELNMAGNPKYVAELKRAEAAGKALDSADMLSAGNVVTPPKGHGTEYGVPVPTLASAAEAQQFVDERIAEGSDYIKIILEDGHLCHTKFSKFSREELAAVVAAAHKQGKISVVHISSQEDAREAIAAGGDGVAHLFADSPPEPDFAEFARRHHAFVITTLTAIQSSLGTPSGASLLTDKRLAGFLPADVQSQLKAPMPFTCTGKLENAFAAAQQLHDAGVHVLARTDAPAPGSSNGVSIHGELQLLVLAGFSPTDALAAATSAPATVFKLDDRGRIASGLRANLLLVHGDPTQDITATRDIAAVWKVGIKVHRATLHAAPAK